MRWVLLVLASLCFGCDDEAYYADGTPWENVAVPFRAPAIPIGSMDARQQATYFAQAGILADNKVKTFTPTWTGFSVAPTGDLSYYDFGPVVMIWADSSIIGTSNTTGLAFTNLPDQLKTNGQPRLVLVNVTNNANTRFGYAEFDGTNNVDFFMASVIGTEIGPAIGAFSNFGNKGVPPGFLAIYAK